MAETCQTLWTTHRSWTSTATSKTVTSRLAGTPPTTPIAAAWETAPTAPRWTGAPCWTHSDLMPSNLLGADGRPAAVIDFGTAGVGAPAIDLTPARNLNSPTRVAAGPTSAGHRAVPSPPPRSAARQAG
ncbi:phosphotransferase [Streptomyces sp. NPDC001781]